MHSEFRDIRGVLLSPGGRVSGGGARFSALGLIRVNQV